MTKHSEDTLQRRRKRGFYTETALVRKLQKCQYLAVRVPVTNPSRNPLPDVIARRNKQVYAFEVKTAGHYAYFDRKQIDKLFAFLDQFIPIPNEQKHAVLAARFGRQWIFREPPWISWQNGLLPEKMRLTKQDRGDFDLKCGRGKAAKT